jgi:hypothetical protein
MRTLVAPLHRRAPKSVIVIGEKATRPTMGGQVINGIDTVFARDKSACISDFASRESIEFCDILIRSHLGCSDREDISV